MTGFLAVGHVSRDVFPDGTERLGGSALYAAATAARLGLRTSLVTRVGPREGAELSRVCRDLGIDVRALDGLVTTTFALSSDGAGGRVLRLLARTKAIALADVPADLRSPDVLLLATIARDVGEELLDRAAFAGSTRVVVLAAQGLLRAWGADGTVRPAPWPRAEGLPGGLSCVVIGEDDLADRGRDAPNGGGVGGAEDRSNADLAIPRRWSRRVPVVLTRSDRGARIFEGGRVTAEVPAYAPTRVVDETGAGDVFAAGAAVALREGKTLARACAFASAVASFAVEGEGISALASRDAVERRLAG